MVRLSRVPYIRIAMTAEAPAMSRREYNTAHREPWNDFIRESLKIIDIHNTMYFQTSNIWHLEKAKELRKHITELKEMIKRQER
jgi:hypothetical protein